GRQGVADLGLQRRQSIALARALATKPSVLLLDEPTSALDSQAEAEMIARLRRATEGRTLLLVTHRMSMLKLVDRIIVLDRGQIVLDGRPDEIIRSLSNNAAPAVQSQPNVRELPAPRKKPFRAA
ncbi:MAG: type I secretion system permease/ATPase, partial [Pseudomonadota bacterium]